MEDTSGSPQPDGGAVGDQPLDALLIGKWKHVASAIHSDGDKAMLRWGTLRLAMLCVPMMLNTWLYYQFVNVAFGYMGIIGFVESCFCLPPTRTRYIQEMK